MSFLKVVPCSEGEPGLVGRIGIGCGRERVWHGDCDNPLYLQNAVDLVQNRMDFFNRKMLQHVAQDNFVSAFGSEGERPCRQITQDVNCIELNTIDANSARVLAPATS